MALFDSVVLFGDTATIVYGYLDAARVRGWRIRYHRPTPRHDGKWRLTATLAFVDRPLLRRGQIDRCGLLFTAPRDRGRWCWPLEAPSVQIGATTLVAILGPPEQ